MEYLYFTCNDSSTTIACFVCNLCHVIVRPQDFVSHLSWEIHKPNSQNSRFSIIKKHREEIAVHILNSHGILNGASFPPLPVEMDLPIPSIEPYLGFVCPQPDCIWGCKKVAKGKSYNYDAPKQHFAKKHKDIIFDPNTLLTRFIMSPYCKVNARDPDFSLVIRLLLNWTPPKPSGLPQFQQPLARKTFHIAPRASFLEDLGWSSKFNELKNLSLHGVLLILSMPRPRQLTLFDGKETRLYRALLEIKQLIPGYLLDGNRFAFSHGPEVVTTLTAG